MSFITLIAIIVLTFSIASALILCIKPEQGVLKNKTLGFSLLIYSVFLLVGLLWYQAGYIIKTPYLIRTVNPFMFFAMPLFYFYVRNTVKGLHGIQKYDWIHFLPGIIHFLELIPFYSLSYEEKLAIAHQLVEAPNLLDELASGLIPGVYVDSVRILLQIGYFIGSCRLIINIDPKFFFDLNVMKLKNWLFVSVFWMSILVFAHSGYFIAEVLENYGFAVNPRYNLVFSIGILSALTALSLYVNFHPEWVYGGNKKNEDSQNLPQKTTDWVKEEVAAANSGDFMEEESYPLDPALMEVKKRIEDQLKECVFQNPNLNAGEFAEKIGVPPRQLSANLKEIYGKGYKELINHWRIQAAIDLIESGYLDNRTIESLCKEVGFNSRITFFTVFKKETGVGPSEYFKGNFG